jgi:hypothetical protein
MESHSTPEKADALRSGWDKLQMTPPGISGGSGERVFKSASATEIRMNEEDGTVRIR